VVEDTSREAVQHIGVFPAHKLITVENLTRLEKATAVEVNDAKILTEAFFEVSIAGKLPFKSTPWLELLGIRLDAGVIDMLEVGLAELRVGDRGFSGNGGSFRIGLRLRLRLRLGPRRRRGLRLGRVRRLDGIIVDYYGGDVFCGSPRS
jgi:hypothetical protein